MGTQLNVNSPLPTDTVSDYPVDEQQERADVRTLITKEHYEGTAGNDRHQIPVVVDDAARDALYGTDSPPGAQEGNFTFQEGIPSAADAPRIKAASFHDGTVFQKGLYLFPGLVLQCAFDPTTIEAVSGGSVLPAFGGAFAEVGAYAELFAVIGHAFDEQNNVAPPAGGMFRVPNIAGSIIMGLSPDIDTPASYVRGSSGLDDFRPSGGYTGPGSTIYIVRISATGAPDSFEFSSDAGANYQAGGTITAGGPNPMDFNVVANFTADTGHAIDDVWIFSVDPSLGIIGGTGGASAWQLVEAEIPKITPTIPSSGAHTHTTQAADNGSGTDDFRLTDDFVGATTIQTSSSGSDHTHPVDEFGGDQAHNTTPKVLVFGSVIVT